MKTVLKLKGKKIVVIGGSSGIGKAVTEILSQNEAELIITGRNKEKLENIKNSNSSIKSTAVFDFTDEKAVKDFFNSTEQIDHLIIVAAGAPKTGLFLNEGSLNNIQDYYDQKFRGVLHTAYYGIPKLKANGSITFLNGLAGKKAIPECTPISIVNSAIVALAKNLVVEIKPKRANVICIGVVDSGAWDAMGEQGKKDFFETCASGNILGRIGQPEDVAQAIQFILTSDYINGIVLDIVGGDTVDFMQ